MSISAHNKINTKRHSQITKRFKTNAYPRAKQTANEPDCILTSRAHSLAPRSFMFKCVRVFCAVQTGACAGYSCVSKRPNTSFHSCLSHAEEIIRACTNSLVFLLNSIKQVQSELHKGTHCVPRCVFDCSFAHYLTFFCQPSVHSSRRMCRGQRAPPHLEPSSTPYGSPRPLCYIRARQLS